ncbi:NUDIX domain-containing protein [Sphaerisporangium album]|uniref:NUDIX domain-containing protein n=1 Tax=Sphaerisporangium album TaxID=509200 RepID=UPI001C692DF1|nr:NUDIX domain-containing protein [Sphaerisporangium album]
MRAILITPSGALLTIKRVRPGVEPYWVLPGGGVEPTDASLEAALTREIREELAGDAVVHALVQINERGDEREYFYLARIAHWDSGRRTGPEFADRARGEYIIETSPLTAECIARIALKPASIAELIADHATELFQLADLRTQTV